MIPGNINTDLISGADEAAYQISRSLRFNSSDSAYCDRSFTSAGNRKTWTFAAWVKLSALTGTNSSGGGTLFHCRNGTGNDGITDFLINTDGTVVFTGGASTWLTTTQVLRDFSAWYHLVMSVDTTAATASNRLRLYINGSQVTTFNVNVSPTQNSDLAINQAATHRIGGHPSFNLFFNGYLADIHFIDGQALTPSSFTETSATTGQLIPKAYSGSFGTNGFWLKFSDNSAATATTLGKDYSGNNNNFTPNNLSVTAGAGNDSLVDTPTSYGTDTGAGGEVRGNYSTWGATYAGAAGLSNGNLDFLAPTTMSAFGSISVTSGKWYWEILNSGTGLSYVGIIDSTITSATDTSWSTQSRAYVSGGSKYNGSSSSYGSSWAAGDVIGFALDLDSNSLTFYKNGVSQGVAFSTGLIGKEWKPFVYGSSGSGCSANFGQRPFTYAAPSGFKALCDTNLPAPVVAKPSTVMDVALYTGTGSSLTVSSLGFSPDLVWLKSRGVGRNHRLTDTVRGATKVLQSDVVNAEITEPNGLTAFNSNGFTVGSTYSISSEAWVGWCFDAGSNTVSNTAGSITSQVRANPSAGFSIVAYTGTGVNATVGHGLGVAPGFFIVKQRTNAGWSWNIYHISLGPTKVVRFTTDLPATVATIWNNAAPTSAVFSLGNANEINQSTSEYIAYCFAPVAGYSSFGSYTGNGSADGPFVYTGFRPRCVMIKRTDAAGENWWIKDAVRSPYNAMAETLFPSSSAAEISNQLSRYFDFTSNGFKLRGTDTGSNVSGGTYIYAAFAENPFQYARAR